MMRLGAAALAALLLANPASAQNVDCDQWAQSDAAWPEVERILRDNYAYLHRVEDIDALFARAGESAADVQSVGELGAIAEALGYAFRDGHFHVRPVTAPERAWIPSSSDIWLATRNGRWFVADVRRGSVAFDRGVRPGWEVTAMDGTPIAELARSALAPVVEQPTLPQIEYAVNVVATGRLGQERSFSFSHNGMAHTMTLPPAQQALGSRSDALFDLTDHDGVLQIRFNNSLGNNDLIPAFDALMAEIDDRAPAGIILDLRDTPGGGNTTVARAILGWFMREPAVYQIHRNHFEEAVFGVPRQYAEYVFVRGDGQESPRFRPVSVLAGYWTGSVGEALAMAFDRTGNYETIGTWLGDLLGTLNRNTVENGCISLSFAWDSLYAIDGTPREDWEPGLLLPHGDTAPDGSDPALAAALERMVAEEARE